VGGIDGQGALEQRESVGESMLAEEHFTEDLVARGHVAVRGALRLLHDADGAVEQRPRRA
jgi:hypothetical protein